MKRVLLLLALALTGCAGQERTAVEEPTSSAPVRATLLGCPADCLGRRLERQSAGSAAAVACKAASTPGLYACSSLVAFPGGRSPECRMWTIRDPATVLTSRPSACPIRTLLHGLTVRTA